MGSQNDGNSWMSVTPCKPVLTGSELNPAESNQIETSNWQELLGIYGGLLQEETPSNGVVVQNCSAAAVEGLSPAVIGEQNGYMTNNGSSICNSYNQIDGNWSGNQENNMNSYQKNVDNTSQDVKDGISIPYWPFNTLHSPMMAESGQSSASFQLGPVTQDHRKLMQNQLCNIQYPPTEQISNWKSEQQKTLAPSVQQKNVGNFHSDFETLAPSVQQKNVGNFRSDFGPRIPKWSARGITASPVENQPSLDGNPEGIDLNRTPKLSTPAKRRKHRPKVVREGKQKGTPNAPTPLSTPTIITNSENQTSKRKYVRRKSSQASTTQTKNTAEENKIQEIHSASKSCQRQLNFSLEEVTERDRHQINDSKTKEQKETEGFINQNSKNQGSQCRAVNNIDIASAMFKEKQQGYSTLGQHTSTVMHPTNKMLIGMSSLLTSTAAACTSNSHTLNVIAKTLSMRNASHYQPISQNGYNILGDSSGQIVQTNSCYAGTGRARPLLQSTSMFNGNGVYDQRGSKRAYHHTADVLGHLELNPLNNSQWLCNQMDNNTKYYVGSSKISSQSPETAEKSKVSDVCDGNESRLSAFNSLRTKETGVLDGIYRSSLPSEFMERIPDPYPGMGSNLKKPRIAVNQISGNHHVNQTAVGDNFLKQNAFPQVHRGEHKDDKMYQWQTKSSRQNALVPVGNWNVPFPLTEVPRLNELANVANLNQTSSERNAQYTKGHEIETSHTKLPAKWQARKPKISKKVIKKERMFPDHQSLDTKLTVAGSRDHVYLGLLHDMLEKLQSLQINGSSTEIRGDGQNALVPYIGHGSVVPYKDPIKKRKPRAKVNLDAESNRLWNLLMWNEGSESTENMDKHTEKWWEEERKVFRGRIDSFIARMHLVQGDRRFSPWKGSVVDSVIGVFLTQNVSDHLSSSAFMSLVAKFPLLSVKEHHQNTSDVIVEEPDSDVIVEEPDLQTEPGVAISYHDGISSKPVLYQSSTTCSGTSEQQTEDIMTGLNPGKKSTTTEEEVISSQSSSNSFVYQAIEEVKFTSDANSGIENQTIVGNFHPDQYSEEHCLLNVIDGSLTLEGPEFWHQQAEYVRDDWNNSGNQRGCTSHDYQSNFGKLHFQGCDPSSSLPYSQEPEAKLSKFSVEGGIYSLPLVEEEEYHFSRPIGQMTKRVNAAPGQVTRKKEILGPNVNQQPPPFYQSDSMSISGPNINGRCSKQSMVHDGDTSLNTSVPASTFSLRQAELTKRIPDDQSRQNRNPDTAKGSTGIPNGRKKAFDRQFKKDFDWDSLRRQAQSSAGTKERSKNTRDSLDYEKLRNADVEEISNTIKERGMNNLLAERIKDFLNRLVQEHERIDLEWLRDVPPQKVKEYLLSINGLGLKSVECVRLLTLHNVAFPVDTNVGRIAVRLGWVPLQPLPESLQLHLLELYPVLETVQKYLWPRLCKLDQKTLYELHYQMITFGKVFCTKSRPNCNACPMRAECRHFASAFASARLALPGPEERSIVNCGPVAVNDIPSMVTKPVLLSPAPAAVNDTPSTVIKPMLLPPAMDNPTEDRGPRNNEPTVEEPKTPEHSGGESESDNEDGFYGDTDEIPSIKLNIEEFITNLKTFMQGHMNVEGDISKAIVAISPMASNTAKQLKGVNRLRTEHYVYELPDYHPLLRGLDRREADDPSPYLLAIWTPGETADSIRPPESKCGNQASESLCQDETCFSCNSTREANSQIVRGTLLIPCRTAMRGSFPLNGTYFQVNEMFADHASSINPIDVPRAQIWNLPRRTVYFGTSVTSIFRGLTTEEIQFCFWRGFVCVRGFEQKTRSPKPLSVRLHVSLSKQVKTASEENKRMPRNQKERQS